MTQQQRFDLTGKVVVVTGGTGLLGSAYCQGLADQGAQVVMADLAAADPVGKAQAVKTPDGRPAFGIACDVGVEADVIHLFEQVMAQFGQVNVVLNLTGVYLVAREGGKAMLKSGGGSMVNVSSTYGVVGPDHRIYDGMPFNSLPSYAAAKAGVHGLTRWLATYWGDKGIRVNTLVPGGVENNHDPEFVRRYTARVPLGRMAKREDMVGMMIYLASDASAYSTGQQFFVDGGWTAV